MHTQDVTKVISIVLLPGLTLGFERTTYSFNEPPAGTSLTREDICITVSSGELGFSLVIVPQWTSSTATGMCWLYRKITHT